MPQLWKANTAYSYGSLVKSASPAYNGMDFYIYQIGTSGAIEPHWNGLGQTTLDGSCVWITHSNP